MEAVRVQRQLAAERGIQERSTSENIQRASRTFRDAGLSWRALDQAMDLYLMHGTPLEAAISAVGGRRMSVEAARTIERALVPRDNPNDDRAYFHALDLHAAGQPIGVAILNANAEAATHRAREKAMRVQVHELRPVGTHAPPAAPRRRDFQTPEQHRENANDNRAAAAGIGLMLALFAGMAWLLFGKPSEPPSTPPTQPGPPVKPTAPPTQPPKSQPPPPVKRKAWPQR
jgi:hypothetical protein